MPTSRRALAVLAAGCLLALAGCGSGSEEPGSIRVELPAPNPVERVGAFIAQDRAVSLSTEPHPGLISSGGNCNSQVTYYECFSFGAFVSGSGISSPLGWEYTVAELIDGNVATIIDDVPAGSGRTLTLEMWSATDASNYDAWLRNGVLLFRGQVGGLKIEPHKETFAGVVLMSYVDCPFTVASGLCPDWRSLYP